MQPNYLQKEQLFYIFLVDYGKRSTNGGSVKKNTTIPVPECVMLLKEDGKVKREKK